MMITAMGGVTGARGTIIKNGVAIVTVTNGEVITKVMRMDTAMKIEVIDPGISNPIITTPNLSTYRHQFTMLRNNHQASACFSPLIFVVRYFDQWLTNPVIVVLKSNIFYF
jgi:uncharacterized protein (DUF39 family)